MRIQIAGVALLAVLGMAGQAHADNGYLKIVGAKQGELKGSVTAPKTWAGQSEVVAIDWGVSQPVSTGVAIARRQHDPLTLTLRWTKTTPQLLQAATTNETLTSVVYSDVVPGSDGVDQLRHTIQLTNARVTAIKVIDKNGNDYGVEPLVVVSFAYQKMTMTEVDGGISGEDDWVQAP